MGRFLAFSAIIRLARKTLPKIERHYVNTYDNFSYNDFTYTGNTYKS